MKTNNNSDRSDFSAVSLSASTSPHPDPVQADPLENVSQPAVEYVLDILRQLSLDEPSNSDDAYIDRIYDALTKWYRSQNITL